MLCRARAKGRSDDASLLIQSVNHSFKSLALAVIAFAVAAYGISGWFSYKRIINDYSKRTAHIVRMGQSHLESMLSAHNSLLDRIEALLREERPESMHDNEKYLHKALKGLIGSVPYARVAFIWDKNGNAVASSAYYPVSSDMRIAGSYGFPRQDLHHFGSYIIDSKSPARHAERNILLGRQIKSGSGDFQGYITVALRAEYLKDYYKNVLSGNGHISVTLLLDNGEVLERYPESELSAAKSISSVHPIMQFFGDANRNNPVETIGEINGVRHISVTRTIHSHPVFLRVAFDQSKIMKRWRKDLFEHALLVFPPTIVILLLISVGMQKARYARYLTVERDKEVAHRKQIQEELRQAHKLETLGELSAGIAHDFNNVLNIIQNNAALMQQAAPGSDNTRNLASIRRASEQARMLTQDLLRFASRQPLRCLPVALAHAIPSFCAMARHVLPVCIELKYEVAADTWAIETDPIELELALLNITVNARDAMPEGGRLTIQVHNLTKAETHPATLTAGDYVVVSISDTGEGIRADVMERIFEPFFTTKPIGKGTGLGLSRVYGFMKQSGGTITAANLAERGAMFSMFFPRCENAPIIEIVPKAEAMDTARP